MRVVRKIKTIIQKATLILLAFFLSFLSPLTVWSARESSSTETPLAFTKRQVCTIMERGTTMRRLGGLWGRIRFFSRLAQRNNLLGQLVQEKR